MTEDQVKLESPSAPRQTRLQELWRLFRENRLAILGLIIFVLFFLTAVSGVILTSGQKPVFDPSMVRLQEKLLPPLTRPNIEALQSAEVPALGIYLFGTDDLGRDVFARMLQGAWVSLTVGFVAVGIAVLVGIFMGGIAGYFGQDHICVNSSPCLPVQSSLPSDRPFTDWRVSGSDLRMVSFVSSQKTCIKQNDPLAYSTERPCP